MDFENWLVKRLLEQQHINKEQLQQARLMQQRYLTQGHSIALSSAFLKCEYIKADLLGNLQQQFQEEQKTITTNISSSTQEKTIDIPSTMLETKKIDNSLETVDIPSEKLETGNIDDPLEKVVIPPEKLEKGNIDDLLDMDFFTDGTSIPSNPPGETVVVPGKMKKISQKKESLFENTSLDITDKDQETASPKKFGRYKIIKKLGQGNMGQVFLALDSELNRKVALKVVLAEAMGDETNIKRFRREAQAIAKLHHPNIVGIYDIGQEKNNPYLTMDYIVGQSLYDYLKKKKRKISPKKAAAMVCKLAKSLVYAHENNVVHRDIKPANIMLDEAEEPYLMDFGLARDIDGGNKISRTGIISGTIAYMAPEQANGRSRDIDGRSDVYALGATFYEMLTGRMVFPGTNTMTILLKVASEAPTPLREIQPNLPAVLEQICLKCLEKPKEDRYDAKGLAEDLEKFLSGNVKASEIKKRTKIIPDKVYKIISLAIFPLLLIILVALLAGPKGSFSDKEYLDLKKKHKKAKLELVKWQQQYKILEKSHVFALLRAKQNKSSDVSKLEAKLKILEKKLKEIKESKQQLQLALEKREQQLQTMLQKGQAALQSNTRNKQNLPQIHIGPLPKTSWQMFRGNLLNTATYKTKGVYQGNKIKWKFLTHKGIFSSPAIYKGKIFFGSDDGHFYAANLKNGQMLWKFPAQKAVGSSPCIYNGLVYFGSYNGFIYALRLKDGKLKWSYKTQGKVPASPKIKEGIVYCGSADNYLYAINAQSGKLVWKFDSKGPIWSSAAIAGEIIYFGNNNGFLYALSLKQRKVLWNFNTKGYISCSPAVLNQRVYFSSRDGYLYAVNSTTGKLYWRYQTYGQIASSPAVDGKTVVVGSHDGHIYAIDVYTGSLKWKYKTQKQVFSSPAIADGLVYCGGVDGKLYALDITNGKLKWHFLTNAPIASSPVIANGVIYFGGYDAYLYAISD